MISKNTIRAQDLADSLKKHYITKLNDNPEIFTSCPKVPPFYLFGKCSQYRLLILIVLISDEHHIKINQTLFSITCLVLQIFAVLKYANSMTSTHAY